MNLLSLTCLCCSTPRWKCHEPETKRGESSLWTEIPCVSHFYFILFYFGHMLKHFVDIYKTGKEWVYIAKWAVCSCVYCMKSLQHMSATVPHLNDRIVSSLFPTFLGMCMFKACVNNLIYSLHSSLQPWRHAEMCDLSLCHHVAWDLRWNAEDSDLHVQVRDHYHCITKYPSMKPTTWVWFILISI